MDVFEEESDLRRTNEGGEFEREKTSSEDAAASSTHELRDNFRRRDIGGFSVLDRCDSRR